MKIENDLKLDFSDVLIRPKRSELSSRNDVTIEREFIFKHSGKVWNGVPIICANMTSVSSIELARVLQKYKMITCLHKYIKAEDIPSDLDGNYYAVSIGIQNKDLENLDDIMIRCDPEFICIDVPNGYIQSFVDVCKLIREKYPKKTIIAGNIVSREMVEELSINAKVDIIKCGIGGGSACITRSQTGVGMPQLSCIMECADAAHGVDTHIISDGGIVTVGDISKAFGAGSDFVMMGGMFSGHDESPGDIVEESNKKFKYFYGMSSSMAMNNYHGGVSNYRSSEGRVLKVPYKGPVENTVLDILGGLRSSMTYIGAQRLKDFSKCTTFIRVNTQLNKSLEKFETSYSNR
jgi:GMP reductase